jgi:cation transport ATPase
MTRELNQIRAARLRAVATRWAIGKTALGMVFLLGAMSHVLGPAHREQSSMWWAAMLVVLSTLYVGMGLRGFARVRRRGTRLWMVLTGAWGILAAVMLGIVSER